MCIQFLKTFHNTTQSVIKTAVQCLLEHPCISTQPRKLQEEFSVLILQWQRMQIFLQFAQTLAIDQIRQKLCFIRRKSQQLSCCVKEIHIADFQRIRLLLHTLHNLQCTHQNFQIALLFVQPQQLDSAISHLIALSGKGLLDLVYIGTVTKAKRRLLILELGCRNTGDRYRHIHAQCQDASVMVKKLVHRFLLNLFKAGLIGLIKFNARCYDFLIAVTVKHLFDCTLQSFLRSTFSQNQIPGSFRYSKSFHSFISSLICLYKKSFHPKDESYLT